MSVEFELDGRPVAVRDEQASLLDALRSELGVTSAKDGCSPQGQCGCCTVLVDGSPRVACVTPVARVRGRSVTTVDGLDDAEQWADAFHRTGASQCGFCTPGIIVRLSALDPRARQDRAAVDKALLAHLCRCTGWQTIREACVVVDGASCHPEAESMGVARDIAGAERRAAIEGGVVQSVGPHIALGGGGFADDDPPDEALVAIRDGRGEWIVGSSVAELRRQAGITQGRRTTAPPGWPIDVPPGDWTIRLRTTWVEPAYLEPDAAWCRPGGEPSSPLGNGGAFGGKVTTDVGAVARRLADEHGLPVRVLTSREESVRRGPKRPPLALGLDSEGRGTVRVARPERPDDEPLLRERIAAVAPQVRVEFVDVVGPPTSAALRAAAWAEVAAAVSVATVDPAADSFHVMSPDGASATASVDGAGELSITVSCGDPLDEVVLRSYAIGAAHMALGIVRSESISLDDEGRPLDLTMRSFGVLRAVDTPHVEVTIENVERRDASVGEPVNGSDAVFAAVLAAAWHHAGRPDRWPVLS